MSFKLDRKRTPEEIRKSLLACAETQCEQCSFYESDAPRGYSPCYDWLLYTQAAEYIWELMVLKNKENSVNGPLTWEELQQMEGKPVWVEADDGKCKGWAIVGKFYSLLEKEDLDAHVDLYYFGRSMEYSKEMYGSYWQAYRKEL